MCEQIPSPSLFGARLAITKARQTAFKIALRAPLSAAARRDRTKLERDREDARKEQSRILAAIAKGLITDDKAASVLPSGRGDIRRLRIRRRRDLRAANQRTAKPALVARSTVNRPKWPSSPAGRLFIGPALICLGATLKLTFRTARACRNIVILTRLLLWRSSRPSNGHGSVASAIPP